MKDMEGQPKPMDKETVRMLLSGMISQTVAYVDGTLSPARAKATRYYQGKPFGNEEEGRSKVVLTEVRDSVLGVMPGLLETFFGPERPVEFTPKRADTVEQATQATETIYHVFSERNPGFLTSLAVLKDGLVRKIGIFKWWWEPPKETAYRMEGLDASQYEALFQDPEIRVVSATPREDNRWDCDLVRTDRDGFPRFQDVRPEEFAWDPEATTLDDAIVVVHRSEKTVSELRDMGYDQEDIDEALNRESDLRTNTERLERRVVGDTNTIIEGGHANRKVGYYEAYPYLDVDGDGKAELRRICAIGRAHHVVLNEPAEERPFAIFVPDPEPGTLEGQSWADRTMDLQEIRSALTRAGLDGLAAGLFPQTAYQEGMVNPLDLMNKEIGGRIRTRARPADVMMEFKTSSDVPGVLGMLEYFDNVRTARTGQTNGAAVLDTDALQSSTQIAVAEQVSAMKAQGRMLARVFAEMTFKPLFRGLLRLLVAHQPRAFVTRLRGRWIPVDPRTWDADMDVTVNVAIGSGSTQEKLAAFKDLIAEQKEVLQTMGQDNPLVSLVEYRNAIDKATDLAGIKDVTSYFKPLDAQAYAQWQQAQAQQAAASPPPPTPEQVVAQAEIEINRMKAEKDMQIAEAREMREHRKLELDNDLERDRLAADITLREKELELKYSAQLSAEHMRAEIQRERNTSAAEGGSE